MQATPPLPTRQDEEQIVISIAPVPVLLASFIILVGWLVISAAAGSSPRPETCDLDLVEALSPRIPSGSSQRRSRTSVKSRS